MSNTTMIILIAVALAIVIGIWIFARSKRTRRLRNKFGPEYDRTVNETGGKTGKAEAILDERQKRVSKLNVRPLGNEERDRFAAEWREVQTKFVDEPKVAVWRADALVHRALQARGYPMADFEEQAGYISVEYPDVVQNYRSAHDIALRDQQGRATTEELRRAMQHYRNLFEHVLESHVTQFEEVHR